MNPMFWYTFVIKRYLWIAELISDVFLREEYSCSGFQIFRRADFDAPEECPSPGTPAEFITDVLCEICEDIVFLCVQSGPFSVNTEYIQCHFNHLCLIYEPRKI